MFRSYEIDFDARIVRLELVDGSVISEPMATQTPRYDSIRRARLDIERRLLVFTLDDDTTLETELGSSGQLPQTGVPVVLWTSFAGSRLLSRYGHQPDCERPSVKRLIDHQAG